MVKYLIATFILVSVLSIIAPNEFAQAIYKLSDFYKELGIGKSSDIERYFNEAKRSLGL